MNSKNMYYPLEKGFKWTYKNKDGSFYTNTITKSVEGKENQYIMVNSVMQKEQLVSKVDDSYLTDSYEPGIMNTFLKDNPVINDSWEIKFNANGFENILVMTIKETGSTKTVNNNTFNNVIKIEAESKIIINGNITPLNFFTQYYYALGVGLILTTSSLGDEQSLSSYTLS